jgi:hypothetical protein
MMRLCDGGICDGFVRILVSLDVNITKKILRVFHFFCHLLTLEWWGFRFLEFETTKSASPTSIGNMNIQYMKK